jgi:hypothetical protein
VIDAPGSAEGASFSEEPATETEVPAPDDVTGDEEPAIEGSTTPTTTTVPAPVG